MVDQPKEVPDNCFLCEERKRYFSLKLKKSVDIIEKVSFLLGVDFSDYLVQRKHINFGICRQCLSSINTAYEVVSKLKTIVAVEDDQQVNGKKRLSSSPLTPIIKHDKNPVKKKRSTIVARSLNFSESEACSDGQSRHDIDLPSKSIVDHDYHKVCNSSDLEHTYSNIEKQNNLEVKSDHLGIIKQKLSDITCSTESDGDQNALVNKVVDVFASNQVLMRALEKKIICVVNDACSSLASKNVTYSSVLSRYRSVDSLVQYGDHLLEEVIHEMSNRIPFVLDLFTVIVTNCKEPSANKIAPITAAYAILMNARCDKLSAWHRLTTIVTMKGQLNDSALTRLNHLGVTMSASTKLRLMDEAADRMSNGIADHLNKNPLVKVTGDNLDIYIRTGHKSLERSNQDLHLFASNVLFCRIATPGLLSNTPLQRSLESITPDLLIPTGHNMETLTHSYTILLGRILVEFKEFSWLRAVIPAHIYHPYQKEMSQKSAVYELPIMMKNEAKHEDCVDILDQYEEVLGEIFLKAFGSHDILDKYHIPVGGDQLTRVRLEEAKQLRSLATSAKKRFEHLQPFVIELWHIKQDYLEKCYKQLFSSKTLRQPGTLYNFKAKLQRTDVNGKVKGAFKSHHSFLLLVGKMMIQEQFLEYFGMDDPSSAPTQNIPSCNNHTRSLSERRAEMFDMIKGFIIHYGYLNSDKDSTDDSVYNYCSNLCHWVLQLIQMEDIAKEGDIVRLIPSLMNSLPFFFSHSRTSKYFEECLDFILKCEFILSPLQRLRVLEGAFTNLRGGLGNNMESDLVQENSVRNQKDMIRALGANKTEKAIVRCSKAADTIAEICEKVDNMVSLKKSGSKHQMPDAEKDEGELSRSLRQLRPFNKTSGRICIGLSDVAISPMKKIDQSDFKVRVAQVVTRLYYGQTMECETDSSEDDLYG